jgi:hypothetical protein
MKFTASCISDLALTVETVNWQGNVFLKSLLQLMFENLQSIAGEVHSHKS